MPRYRSSSLCSHTTRAALQGHEIVASAPALEHRQTSSDSVPCDEGQGVVIGPSDMPPSEGGSDDSGIMRFPLAAKGKVYLQPPVQVGIEFGDLNEGIIIPYGELVEIYDFVRKDVMPKFDGFFK